MEENEATMPRIELNSPTSKSDEISPLRRHFNLRLNLAFPLDKYLSPSVVNLSFPLIPPA
jgi:hypothetical protein